jgi:TRAP-type C4-dicarboxylate transport system substrate-binding protein
MLKKILTGIFVCTLAVSLTSGLQTVQAKDKVYTLTDQANWIRSDPAFASLETLVESAKKYSNGRLNIELFAEGEIVPFDQTLTSVKLGTVDMMDSAGVFWEGVIPVGGVEFGLPMSYIMPWEKTFEAKAQALRDLIFKDGLVEIIRAEYAKQGHYWLDFFPSGSIVTLAKKPLKTLADWKGIKVGADGINLQYYKAVAASGVVMSPADVYMGLKLGTIEARDWDIGAITGLKWHEVAPYWIQGHETYLVNNMTISLNKWNSLPKDIQDALTQACEDRFYSAVKVYKGEFDKADELIKKGELTVVQIDDEVKQKFKKEADKIMDEAAKRDEASAKAIGIIRAWKAKHSM